MDALGGALIPEGSAPLPEAAPETPEEVEAGKSHSQNKICFLSGVKQCCCQLFSDNGNLTV